MGLEFGVVDDIIIMQGCSIMTNRTCPVLEDGQLIEGIAEFASTCNGVAECLADRAHPVPLPARLDLDLERA